MTLHDLEDFYREYLKTHTVNSARKVYAAISGAFREAIREGLIQVNLADKDHLEFPKAEKYTGGSAYTAAEVAKLLQAAKEAGEPIRAAITLGVCYGLRRSETLGLRVIRFHDLRHTAASLLAPNVSPQQLQKFLGHEDISTTYGIYAHLLDKERKATSEAMDAVLKNAGVLF